jgi:Tol biopolymer transport system component
VKVLDFGLAKTMAPDPAGAPTQDPSVDGTADGRVLGTPAYMSPEQARGLSVDKRADIWAFGSVLFEMLSGRRPFTGATVSDTIAHILERDPDWTTLPADTPVAIRTLLERCLRKDPKKRLRDIADAVIELEERAALAPAGPSSIEPAAGASRSRERIAWTVAGVLGLALSGLTVLYLRDVRPTPAQPVEFAIPLPENSRYTGTSPEFALSPDGRHVAFAATSDGISKLWIRALATLELRTLPGTEGARSPFWKPDGQTVAFFASGQLKSILLSGGSPVVVCDAPFGGAVSSIGGTWNGADQIVFAAPGGLLWQVSAAQGGAKARQLMALAEGDISHRWPSFLPGGEHFLYLAQRGATDELRVGSLTSANTVSLGSSESHAAYAGGHLFFVRGGNLMAQPFDPGTRRLSGNAVPLGAQVGVDPPWQRGMFSVADTGQLAYSSTARAPSELTWMDPHGRVLGTVGRPGVFFNLDLSPDDQRVAISQLTWQPSGRAEFDIWLIDLTRDGAASRLTDDPAWEFDPTWSPKGDLIAFNSNRPLPQRTPFSLFARASNDSGQDILLVKPEGSVSSPDWARDGRFIVYTVGGRQAGSDLWTVDLNGDRTPGVFLSTRHTESDGAFSPDGRWIAYRSNASGRQEVYVRPFPAAEGVFPISREGGGSPRWRGDGKQLFFLSLDGMMMAADVDSSKGFTSGVPRELFSTHLQPTANARPYDVTKDGTRFLIPQIGQGAPTTVVLNWRARLPK